MIELQAVDADAEAALWTYLFGIDLVGDGDRRSTGPSTTRCAGASPIARRLRVRGSSAITCGCASSTSPTRSPPAPTAPTTRLVVELVDDVPPREQRAVAGRRRARRRHVRAHRPHEADLTLSARPTSARCTSVGSPVSTLAAAGRVTASSRAVPSRRADRFFVAHPSPWCTTHF